MDTLCPGDLDGDGRPDRLVLESWDYPQDPAPHCCATHDLLQNTAVYFGDRSGLRFDALESLTYSNSFEPAGKLPVPEVPSLEQALRERRGAPFLAALRAATDDVTREIAMKALARLRASGDAQVVAALIDQMARPRSGPLEVADLIPGIAGKALVELGRPGLLALAQGLFSPDITLRDRAARALAPAGSRAPATVAPLLTDVFAREPISRDAVAALSSVGRPALPALEDMLARGDDSVRLTAALSTAAAGGCFLAAASILADALARPGDREDLLDAALPPCLGQKLVGSLARLLARPDLTDRAAARLVQFASGGDPRVLRLRPRLCQLLGSPDPGVRYWTAAVVRHLRREAAFRACPRSGSGPGSGN